RTSRLSVGPRRSARPARTADRQVSQPCVRRYHSHSTVRKGAPFAYPTTSRYIERLSWSGNLYRGQISVYETEVCMQTKWMVAVGVAIGFTLAARADEAKKGLSDPQIATVALTAHQIDIDRGKTAM